jgi:hypothetical protein
MIGSKRALVGAALLLAASTASAVDTAYTFTSLTEIVEQNGTSITVTGVLANDTVPSTVLLYTPTERCSGFMETLLKNPGAYILKVTTYYTTYPNGTVGYGINRCSLEVAP